MRVLLVFVFLALAACAPSGRAPAPTAALSTDAPASAPAAAQVRVTPPNFGDADPHDWAGRSPASYPVHGIDTSRWQGTIDWPTARANGVSFAFLKATEGGDILDPAFEANWRAARRAGVPTGAYHFWYHCRPGAQQARWFIRHVPRAAGALPPVLDLEWTPFSPTCRDRRPAAEIRAEAMVFLRLLEAHYGQRPLVYTTPDFFHDTELWRLPGTEFWLRSVAGHPGEVFEGRRWTFWQYSGTGLVPGIGARTDLNVFAGSPAAWSDWLASRTR